jgi:amino acid transporter
MTTVAKPPEVPPGGPPHAAPRRVTLIPLIAATYFMVSGGPFGLEDLIAEAGYPLTIAILFVTPVVWSLPTAMAVGELAAAYPEEGGYYVWVRRALGPFWGVQEAWLSLAASFFDLAIYPTLFSRYLAQLWAPAANPAVSVAVGIGLIAAATALNMRGARTTTDASVLLGVAMLSPFVALTLAAFIGPVADPVREAGPGGGTVVAGLAIAMWNYMGWDNASTIAGEVKDPGRTYPRTMLITVVLVALTYVIPVMAVAHSGLKPSAWTDGTWALASAKIGGPRLAIATAVAGMGSSAGMLMALVMSYSRLPLVLAKDGYIPRWLGKTSERTGAPWAALLVSGVLYAACLGLGFKRLVQLDVVIYGVSLALEFVALAVLRLREPDVVRPFRVPGGLPGVVLVGVLPMGLLVLSLVASGREEGGPPLVAIVASVIAVGCAMYGVRAWRMKNA